MPSALLSRSGTSYTRPSKRGSSGCCSRGSTSRPMGICVRLHASGIRSLVAELAGEAAAAPAVPAIMEAAE